MHRLIRLRVRDSDALFWFDDYIGLVTVAGRGGCQVVSACRRRHHHQRSSLEVPLW